MATNGVASNFRSGNNNNNVNVNNNGSFFRSSTNPPCRYFLNGSCRDGIRCRFSHDRNNIDRTTANLCKYYLRGNCTYGESCKYEHSRPLNVNHQRSGGVASAGESSKVEGVSSRSVAELAEIVKKTNLRAEAQEFIPGAAFNGFTFNSSSEAPVDSATSTFNAKDILCPYHILGNCWYGDQCSFTHGTICDLCDRPVLHPTDTQLNRKHREECIAEHERDMQAAFAVARGKEKQCGICMEVVLEKANMSDRRFGILPSCKHCFCLECIRKWRQAKQFENKIIRACPECRTVSDFVAPSSVWAEDEEEKRSLIEAYKTAMKEKTCKYVREGKVECPFGNKCFYRHVKPDGTVVPGDSPRTIRRRQRQRQRREGVIGGGGALGNNGAGNGNADLYFLWDFLEENDWRRNRLSPDDWPWEFQIDDELDWLSLTDSESDYYDY